MRILETCSELHPSETLPQLAAFLGHDHTRRVSAGSLSLADQARTVVLIHRSHRRAVTGFLQCFPVPTEQGIESPKDLATLILRSSP